MIAYDSVPDSKVLHELALCVVGSVTALALLVAWAFWSEFRRKL